MGFEPEKEMSNRFLDTPDWGSPHIVRFGQSELLNLDASLADVVSHARGRLCYLATPYSKIALCDRGAWHQGASLEAAAHAARWAKALAVEGVTAVSPIVQAVEMIHGDLADMIDPLDAVFWEGWCRPLLMACDVVIVPPIPGWAESQGIWREVWAALYSHRYPSPRVFLIGEGEGAVSREGKPSLRLGVA